MKRLLSVALIVSSICFVGCGNNDERVLNDFITSFSSKVENIDPNEKPMFSMIGAVDGVIFDNDRKPVKIYEYASEDALEKAKEEFSIINDTSKFEQNGKFLIETSSDEMKQIFREVK